MNLFITKRNKGSSFLRRINWQKPVVMSFLAQRELGLKTLSVRIYLLFLLLLCLLLLSHRITLSSSSPTINWTMARSRHYPRNILPLHVWLKAACPQSQLHHRSSRATKNTATQTHYRPTISKPVSVRPGHPYSLRLPKWFRHTVSTEGCYFSIRYTDSCHTLSNQKR